MSKKRTYDSEGSFSVSGVLPDEEFVVHDVNYFDLVAGAQQKAQQFQAQNYELKSELVHAKSETKAVTQSKSSLESKLKQQAELIQRLQDENSQQRVAIDRLTTERQILASAEQNTALLKSRYAFAKLARHVQRAALRFRVERVVRMRSVNDVNRYIELERQLGLEQRSSARLEKELSALTPQTPKLRRVESCTMRTCA
jgi:hypothetical protein